MNTSLVLALIGPNTTGIVHRLARTAADHDANWLGARMANLAGEFAGIVHLEVPESKAGALTAALRDVEHAGMRLLITRGEAPVHEPPVDDMRLELVGSDRPGIVRDISGALTRLGVSIENLVTDRVSSTHSGEPLFRATANLKVPGEVATAALRNALESLAHDLMVDLTLEGTALVR